MDTMILNMVSLKRKAPKMARMYLKYSALKCRVDQNQLRNKILKDEIFLTVSKGAAILNI